MSDSVDGQEKQRVHTFFAPATMYVCKELCWQIERQKQKLKDKGKRKACRILVVCIFCGREMFASYQDPDNRFPQKERNAFSLIFLHTFLLILYLRAIGLHWQTDITRAGLRLLQLWAASLPCCAISSEARHLAKGSESYLRTQKDKALSAADSYLYAGALCYVQVCFVLLSGLFCMIGIVYAAKEDVLPARDSHSPGKGYGF